MKQIIISVLMLGTFSCQPQTNTKKTMEHKTENKEVNPLLCDVETGMCEMPGSSTHEKTSLPATQKPVKIIYFTDPICSSCWGIEPQLRKLKLEYGDLIDIEYRMGGLLPDWSYNSGGISKPSDVAHHWDEVSLHYQMPIDGDVWLEDPLNSSYPPSIAYKAAQLQDKGKANVFMRRIREMVFLEKKNITKWEHIQQAAQEAGLDVAILKTDYEGQANQLFKDDLTLAKQMGVRGFPTMYFADAANNQKIVYGSKPYEAYEQAILELFPAAKKQAFDKSATALFTYYPTLTAKEFSILSGMTVSESITTLDKLYHEKYLKKTETKNGSLWKR